MSVLIIKWVLDLCWFHLRNRTGSEERGRNTFPWQSTAVFRDACEVHSSVLWRPPEAPRGWSLSTWWTSSQPNILPRLLFFFFSFSHWAAALWGQHQQHWAQGNWDASGINMSQNRKSVFFYPTIRTIFYFHILQTVNNFRNKSIETLHRGFLHICPEYLGWTSEMWAAPVGSELSSGCHS